jgi:putative membrane protein
MKKTLILFVLTSVATLGTAFAQTPEQDTSSLHFIIHASIANLNEISQGTLAAQKAVRPEVKAFGQHMVADHTKAQAALMQLAKSKGYQVPPEATSPVPPEPMLTKATGKDFDRLYVHMMAPGHRQSVLMFQNYAVNGKNIDLKTFAGQTLPVLKEHLATITTIDAQIKDMAK